MFFLIVKTFGANGFYFGNDEIWFVFGYDSVKCFAVKHINDFKSVCNLHGRCVFVTVNCDYSLSDSLCCDDKFFA
ncbi:hypothetical protein D3C80_2149640 [compost metagenome]